MKHRGFTLIEMLVVIVIIGILSTTVALSITPSPRRALRTEATRLATLLETANAEALAGQRQLAWAAHADGYDFLLADAASGSDNRPRWLAVDANDANDTNDVFRSRKLAENISIGSVEVDGQPLNPGDLLVFRRGDPPLFRIVMVLAGSKGSPPLETALQGLPNGRVSVTGQAQE
jgi:type II secretion system protein H